MKNLSVSIFLLLLLTTSRFVDAGAEFNFSGTLVEEPCVLAPEDSAIEIDFGTVISKLLYSHQRTAGKPFTLHLLECDLSLGEFVNIKFLATEDSLQPGLIALDAISTASGIAIGIETTENKLVPVNKPTDNIALRAGDNALQFQAFISGENESIRKKSILTGSIFSLITFSLDYE